MKTIFFRSFGGLSAKYYFREFLFGLIFPLIILFVGISGGSFNPFTFGVSLVLTFLYPYSRFVYCSIIDFIIGRNVFFVDAGFLLFVKLIMMLLCYLFGFFIAPVGLIYLYFYHSRRNKEHI